jgi:hypothetical protein
MEYKIKKVGNLKYDRLKSMSILKNEMRLREENLSMSDIKSLMDNILNNDFDEVITMNTKYSIDEIFDGNEYEEINDDEFIEYTNSNCNIPIMTSIFDEVFDIRKRYGLWISVECSVDGEFFPKINICTEERWRDLDFRDKLYDINREIKPILFKSPEEAYKVCIEKIKNNF